MKIRQEKPEFDGADEEAAAQALRGLDLGTGIPRKEIPDQYWQNLLVRTNKGIDDVSSPKALSISWAARVAIPGVVAVVSFVVALHYYAPVQSNRTNSLNTIVQSLPAQMVDSMITVSAVRGDEGDMAAVGNALFDVSRDQAEDYFIQNGQETILVETLDDQQADKFFQALNQKQSQVPL